MVGLDATDRVVDHLLAYGYQLSFRVWGPDAVYIIATIAIRHDFHALLCTLFVAYRCEVVYRSRITSLILLELELSTTSLRISRSSLRVRVVLVLLQLLLFHELAAAAAAFSFLFTVIRSINCCII